MTIVIQGNILTTLLNRRHNLTTNRDNTYRLNRYQNLWSQQRQGNLPKPTPMSGMRKNTNLNITQHDEQEYLEQNLNQPFDQSEEQLLEQENLQEVYEDVENFHINASETPQTL